MFNGVYMGKIRVVTNTGPIIHLFELNKQELLRKLFQDVLTVPEVLQELRPNQRSLTESLLTIHNLNASGRDHTKFFVERFELQLGESAALALAKQEKIKIFLTDDLDARFVAKRIGIQPHGTLGLLMRAFRKKILSREYTISLLHELKQTSLFITTDLISWAILEVERYHKNSKKLR
jgi:predicted nucleic acid-binding protein